MVHIPPNEYVLRLIAWYFPYNRQQYHLPYIIFNAITLGEAKESSEIENIVTTFDEIFKEMSYSKTNPASKEVLNYRQAMLTGFELIKENGFLSANHIIRIHHIVEPEAGILIEEKIGKTKLYKNAFSYNLIKLW